MSKVSLLLQRYFVSSFLPFGSLDSIFTPAMPPGTPGTQKKYFLPELEEQLAINDCYLIAVYAIRKQSLHERRFLFPVLNCGTGAISNYWHKRCPYRQLSRCSQFWSYQLHASCLTSGFFLCWELAGLRKWFAMQDNNFIQSTNFWKMFYIHLCQWMTHCFY